MVIFWTAGAFIWDEKDASNAVNIFVAIFCIMFGAYAAGSTKQYGPSISKGIKSAQKIFDIVDEIGEIDPFEVRNDNPIFADKSIMKGEIEFVDVWFRYPTWKEAWILKGISFKIKA